MGGAPGNAQPIRAVVRPQERWRQSGLQLAAVSPAQVGAYTVVVTNAEGGVISAPAMFNVIPRVERRPIPGAIKVTGETGSLLNVDHASTLNPVPD